MMERNTAMTRTPLTVVAFQMSIDSDLSERAVRAIALMENAFTEHGEGIYVLPEYYLAHLFPDPNQTAALAEAAPGPSTEPFLEFAARTGSVVVVGLLEKSHDPERPYNTAAILGPEGVAGCYRKTHLWDLSPEKEPYRECHLFTPGQQLSPYAIAGWSVGVMICADGVFPETPRTLALKGADLIVYPNSRAHVGCEAEAASRANLIPLVVSNPVGFNGVDQCRGTSRIVGARGELLGSLQGEREGWTAAELDLEEITRLKTTRCQRTRRRPELYGVLVENPLTHERTCR